MAELIKPKTRRNQAIYQLRKEKMTFEAIAQRYGLTRERIRQICAKQELMEKVAKKLSTISVS